MFATTSLKELIDISYNDYQLSKARWSFGDKVLDLELRCCYRQPSSLSMVTTECTLLPMASKADRFPLETEPVAPDNNTS